ncbi:MAG: ATP-binding protein [Thermodesulfovibrionales bacterium]|jgi:hypothetical protein
MVTDLLRNNAVAIEQELEWFSSVVDARMRLHFGHECPCSDIRELTPPEHDEEDSMYGSFISHYELSFEERLVFIMSLVPHIRPRLLDVFLTEDSVSSREFTEFGGRGDGFSKGFVPTGETVLFLLAGEDLEKRFQYYYLFDQEHFFFGHRILSLEDPPPNSTELSGFLTPSREVIDLVTTGRVREPAFGAEFPARRLSTEMAWDDLVLDPHTMESVLEIKAWIEYGQILLDDLGMGRKIKPGYRSLFHGPPGTGKTLTASLLGKETGRDVYRIDLSMVVSKYVGETEKNLEKVFRAAEHKNWIIFFDEADALFGKRTGVSDANDRYANQVVSFLLQRVEDYAGVVILASNLRSNLDEAFTRRFQSIIHFPMPRPADRYRLWKGSFSDKTGFAGDVNLMETASRYELSGGAIMNVVRYATLMAVKRGSMTITLQDIQEGVRKELQKEGRAA